MGTGKTQQGGEDNQRSGKKQRQEVERPTDTQGSNLDLNTLAIGDISVSDLMYILFDTVCQAATKLQTKKIKFHVLNEHTSESFSSLFNNFLIFPNKNNN